MRKFWLTLAAALTAAGLYAQNNDMTVATQKATLAKEFLQSGEYQNALTGFKEALSIAQECGDEGFSLASTCKNIIPKTMRAIARKALAAGDYDGAVASLRDVVDFAGEYGDTQSASNAKTLIPQILSKKAGDLIEAGKYDDAAQACEEALAADPSNGSAALRLGMALEAMGNYWNAVDAYKKAADNGQAKNAAARLGKCYLQRALDELKSNDFSAAVKDAVSSNEYVPNPQALQIAGNASMMSGNRDNAIKYFEQYLAAAPNAGNLGQVAYVVGALCQENGDNAKALEFFGKASSDPKYGADAKKAIDTINKAAKSSKKRR